MAAKKDQEYAENQEAVGRRVLAQITSQKNKLEEEMFKQANEIESLKAQLSDALKGNKKLKGGTFGMTFDPPRVLKLFVNSEYDR